MVLKRLARLLVILVFMFSFSACDQRKENTKLSPVEIKSFLKSKGFNIFNQPVQLDPQLLKRLNPAGKKDIMLVNFWATWCVSCRKEFPGLKKMQADLKGENFKLVLVNFGEEPNLVNSFLSNQKTKFETVLDQDMKISNDFNVSVLPTTFLVDKEGKAWGTAKGDAGWGETPLTDFLRQLSRQ